MTTAAGTAPAGEEPESPAKSGAKGGSAASLGLIVIVFVVMGGAMLIASQIGAGASTIIAGFTAIFFTLGIGGGSLRTDLRKAAWYGPLTALSASLPRIIAEYHYGAALALVSVVIFVAGLLPVLGRNYVQAGLGLGIATVLGFSLQSDTGSPAQTVIAAFVGVGFVVVLRVLLKFRDPSDVTRDLAAGTLTQTDPGFEPAYTMWMRDRPVRWIGDVLELAVAYRTLHSALSAPEAAIADARAGEVAALVRAKEPDLRRATTSDPPNSVDATDATDTDPAGTIDTTDPASTGPTDPAGSTVLVRALLALDRVAEVARRRDVALVQDAVATRRAFGLASLRSVLTWRSQTLRHALRTTIGVLLTFLLAWATVGTHDPLVTSMATAAFAILQISWTQSLFKAKQRLLGVMGGSALMAVALWLLPQQWLLPVALLAAFGGLWFIVSNQVLSISCFVVVSVGMNVVGRGLDPTRTLLEYVLLLFSGVAVGLLIGFAVVPHLRPDRVPRRVHLATEAAAALLRSTARLDLGSAQSEPRRGLPRDLMPPLYRLRTAVTNLGSPLHHDDDVAGAHLTDCITLATQLETIAILGVLEAKDGRLTSAALERAADTLTGRAEPTQAGAPDDSSTADFVALAQWANRHSAELLTPDTDPTHS